MKYSIKIKSLNSQYWKLIYIINQILIVCGLRSRPEYWGVVYDSVTKQPLDPAIVTIAYVTSFGTETETCITDMYGRYGFLAKPGKFKILARKSNYVFPSGRIKGSSDGIYESLYHGEFFELKGDSEVVAPNIPMDPANFDWNQKAKLNFVSTSPRIKYLLRLIFILFFWIGILAALYYTYVGNHAARFFSAAYGILVILACITPRQRLWGEFIDFSRDSHEGVIHLELVNALLPGVVLGKALVSNGKFLLRANPGTYSLQVLKNTFMNERQLLGSIMITVGTSRLVNISLIVKTVDE